MTNTANLHKLTPFERQVLMYEMFRCCKCIDHSVINQYFPFVDHCPVGLVLPKTALRMITRDFKDLRDAGVINYKYNENEKWFESYDCNYEMNIPENTSEKKKKYLDHLNFICCFINNIMGLEYELSLAEYEEEKELDDCILDYKFDLKFEPGIEETMPNDYDLYKYTDPYVAEYVKLSYETTLKQIKADFEFLQRLGYLKYDFWKRRFCMPDEGDYGFCEIPRQSFGIVRGEDGKFYI